MENGFDVVNLHGSVSGVIPVPVIGQNGNWYVGNKDTGVSAAGGSGTVAELATNLTTEDEGKALDATMGKVLNDKIELYNNDFNTFKTVEIPMQSVTLASKMNNGINLVGYIPTGYKIVSFFPIITGASASWCNCACNGEAVSFLNLSSGSVTWNIGGTLLLVKI